MTEAEWLACDDPLAMLHFLRTHGGVMDRKLRLFIIACCWLCPRLLTEAAQHGVEVAERMVERSGSPEEVRASQRALSDAAGFPLWCAAWFSNPYYGAWDNSNDPNAPTVLALAAVQEDAFIGAEMCMYWATALGLPPAVQAAVLRDVMHAPYRKVFFRTPWRNWNSGIATTLASVAYADCDFAYLSILADVLEDAGCTDCDILNHCRQQGHRITRTFMAKNYWTEDLSGQVDKRRIGWVLMAFHGGTRHGRDPVSPAYLT